MLLARATRGKGRRRSHRVCNLFRGGFSNRTLLQRVLDAANIPVVNTQYSCMVYVHSSTGRLHSTFSIGKKGTNGQCGMWIDSTVAAGYLSDPRVPGQYQADRFGLLQLRYDERWDQLLVAVPQDSVGKQESLYDLYPGTH